MTITAMPLIPRGYLEGCRKMPERVGSRENLMGLHFHTQRMQLSTVTVFFCEVEYTPIILLPSPRGQRRVTDACFVIVVHAETRRQ